MNIHDDPDDIEHLATIKLQDGKIMSVGRLPCCGESCYESTRELFETALKHEPRKNT